MHNEGNYKQGEMRAFRMGENNSKWSDWQGIKLQNLETAHSALYKKVNLKDIQAAHTAQFQKSKRPNQKIGQRTKQTFFQRRHTDG